MPVKKELSSQRAAELEAEAGLPVHSGCDGVHGNTLLHLHSGSEKSPGCLTTSWMVHFARVDQLQLKQSHQI